jgi:DUF1009 family protein
MPDSPHILPFPPRPGQRIGLLAGWGRFPVHFARMAQAQGYAVQCVGIIGMAADEELAEVCDRYQPVPLARIGKAIRFFNRRRVSQAVMAGKVDKRKLFDPLRLFRLVPDWRTLVMWYGHMRDKKDDSLLLAVIREFERDGIQFCSALDFCPELLVKHGFLTRRQPTPAQWKDIRFGWEAAKEMGRLDIGQTVVIHDSMVVAVEALEGTDECIRRSGTLCRRGGLTVVKVAKPQQDRRFDVPTIGTQTLQTMREAGARVLAIEAGMTILLDESQVIALADKMGIAIISLNAGELALRAAA